jgi:hypothetical protein
MRCFTLIGSSSFGLHKPWRGNGGNLDALLPPRVRPNICHLCLAPAA